jgi:hypothetical protein
MDKAERARADEQSERERSGALTLTLSQTQQQAEADMKKLQQQIEEAREAHTRELDTVDQKVCDSLVNLAQELKNIML